MTQILAILSANRRYLGARKGGVGLNSWQVGVAAEAFVAGQFTRYGYDVSVQYGAH